MKNVFRNFPWLSYHAKLYISAAQVHSTKLPIYNRWRSSLVTLKCKASHIDHINNRFFKYFKIVSKYLHFFERENETFKKLNIDSVLMKTTRFFTDDVYWNRNWNRSRVNDERFRYSHVTDFLCVPNVFLSVWICNICILTKRNKGIQNKI